MTKSKRRPGNETCTRCHREGITVCCDGKRSARWCATCCRCSCHKKEKKQP